MKDNITNTIWYEGAVVALCFVVFTITNQAPKATPCNLEEKDPVNCHCNFGTVRGFSMDTWMKLAILAFCVGITTLWLAKSRSDSGAGEESRNAPEDMKAHKSACEEYDRAKEAIRVAAALVKSANAQKLIDAQDDYQARMDELGPAETKMEDARPLRGMEWVNWRKSTRFYYCLSVVCVSSGAIFAIIAFFLSLEAEKGCIKNYWYFAFYGPAAWIVIVSCHFLYAGVMHN
jgi:hypothetical protein